MRRVKLLSMMTDDTSNKAVKSLTEYVWCQGERKLPVSA